MALLHVLGRYPSFGRPRRITEEERVFLEALAGQCSLAVERAGLYEREHTTAETLQRSLLPDQLPVLPGLVLAASYWPVAKNMEISGDWYDAFVLADMRLAIAIGDVMGKGLSAMGKGLSAAATAGRVRNALRTLALTDSRPAAVLGGLDRLFSATEPEEQVTTVAYLVIDPETGKGMLGNAGHLPPLVLEAGMAPRFDRMEAGTPLGWAIPRKQHPFSLRPGSTAVFYSDGLVENRNRGLDAGLDELAAVAARVDEDVLGHPERLLEYLVDHMLAGHDQDDDVTVLVMHVPSGGQTRDRKIPTNGGRHGSPGDRGAMQSCLWFASWNSPTSRSHACSSGLICRSPALAGVLVLARRTRSARSAELAQWRRVALRGSPRPARGLS